VFILIQIKVVLEDIQYTGLLIGLIAFFAIGVFHPLVIKAEYYYGKKIWPLFLVFGMVCGAISLFLESDYVSAILGVVGVSAFWSIFELFEQEKRVLTGRAKKNPKRLYADE